MAKYSRRLLAFALAAACVVLSAHATVRVVSNAVLGGVTYPYFSNAGTTLYPQDVTSGSQEGSSYSKPTLAGTFTVQGATSAYTSSAMPDGLLELTEMTMSGGNVVITGNLPYRTVISIKSATGTVKANTPLVDTSSAVYAANISIRVVDSTVSWSAAETTANSQVVLLTPAVMQGNSAAFITGVAASQASAIVSAAVASGSTTSLQITTNSVVAIDYTTCNLCPRGLVYSPGGAVALQVSSLLRVSHCNMTSASGGLFLTSGSSVSVSVATSSLLLIENVSAPTTTIFNAPAVVSSSGKAVIRYVSVYAIGSTMDSQTSYADVTIASTAAADQAALSRATAAAANTCPTACLNSGSLASAATSCSCTCPTAGAANTPVCTVMYDLLLDYVPKNCGVGCSVCFNETACTTCGAGYTLTAAKTCSASTVPCPANCKTCNSLGVCSVCEDGYALLQNACLRCTVANCIACNASNPNQCTMCVGNSAPIDNVCPNTCTTSNCASCSVDPAKCEKCNDHYGLVNGECVGCADAHCLRCDSNVSICTKCEDTWSVTSLGTCSPVPCSVPNCRECDPSNPTRCRNCTDGLIPDDVTGKCFTSGECNVANCAQCSSTSAYICETCQTGYQLSSDKSTCSATTAAPTTAAPTPAPTPAPTCSVPNCKTCATGNPNYCDYCNAGYYASNGQCVLVGNCYVGNCAQCMLRDSSKCSVCRSGYLLTTTYTCISQHIVVNGAAAPYSLWVAAAVLLASVATYLA